MKLWKIVLTAVVVLVTSCSIQPKPKLQITHVLAVTQQGDTLTIPIDVIRPVNYRIINYSGYNGWGYNYGWHNPYYNYHRNYDYSYGSTGRSSNNNSSNNTNSNNNKQIPDRANNKPAPPPGVKSSTGRGPE